ncbi:MAG: iron ABC transporter permease [Microbacteriaceae bacterium]|nr:iron ABC transporter permease [Microbacteriaceae bacterium]MDR9444458.1 iron ABC transporter permease [Microbacteriaceae bacterium]
MRQKPPAVLVLLAVFATLISLVPIAYLLFRGSQAFEQLLIELLRPRTLELLFNTTILVVSVTLASLVIGVMQAWLVVRTNLPFRNFFAVAAALPLAMPSYVSAFGWVSLFPGFYGFWPSLLVMTMTTAPYVYLAVAASLVSSNFQAEEVARSLGKNRTQVLKSVTWPIIRPAATASSLLVALYTLSEFGAVATLRFETFTIGVYNAYRSSFDRNAAAAIAIVLVVFTLLILYGERKSRGKVRNFEPHSGKRIRIKISGRYGFASGLLGLAFLGIGIPVAALVRWSVVGSSRAELERLTDAVLVTIGYSIAAGIIITLFALAITLVTVRYKSSLASPIESGVWIGHALPGIVVALSLVFLGANLLPGIYQTIWIVLIAYVALFLPNGLAGIRNPVSQIPIGLDEVGRSLGQSRLQILRRITLPIVSPGVLASLALVTLTVMKELPATLLLRPTGVDTLATRLWALTDASSYAAAAPYGLLLFLLGGIPAWLLNRQIRKTLDATT